MIPAGGISPLWLFVLVGALLLLWFFRHISSMERAGKEPLLATRMFKNRASNLGLVTQNVQWLVLLGLSFVVSVYLQTVRGYSAMGPASFYAGDVGILVSRWPRGAWRSGTPRRY